MNLDQMVAAQAQGRPVQVFNPMNDVQLVALVAAQLASCYRPENAGRAVEEAVDLVAFAIAAVQSGLLAQKGKAVLDQLAKETEESAKEGPKLYVPPAEGAD